MRSALDLFIKKNRNSYGFHVSEIERHHYNSEITYKVVVANFFEVINGNQIPVLSFDTGKVLSWGGRVLESIIWEIAPFLSDFAEYKWKEIKKPIVTHWTEVQTVSIAQQKASGAQTKWTPSGDYTLWKLGELISQVLIAKFVKLKDENIISDLSIQTEGFESNFNKLILLPVETYIAISKITTSNQDVTKQTHEIVDLLVSFTNHADGLYDNMLDPSFEDKIHFLSGFEERQLSALLTIYHEEEERVKLNKKLTDVEKYYMLNDFWESPHGKRLNKLNACRSHGGNLRFEEKEKRKLKSSLEIQSYIEEILLSWGYTSDAIDAGLNYYQLLYEKAALERWRNHKSLNDKLHQSESKMKELNLAIRGVWDADSLQFLGIILGIGIGVGFGFASMMEDNKLLVGVISGILSILILILLIKIKSVRKRILLISNKILK